MVLFFVRRWLYDGGRVKVYQSADSLITYPTVDARVVRHDNGALMVRWHLPAETIIVYGGTSPETIDTSAPLAVTSDVSSVTFNKLDPAQRHYFRIDFAGGPHDGRHVIVAEREVMLAGAVNLRDVGGYRTADGRYTAWGRLYRGGALAELSDADRALLTTMGLSTSCDLRSEEETEEAPDALPDAVEMVGLPVRTAQSRRQQVRSLMRYRDNMDDGVIEAYTKLIVDLNADVFGEIVRRLADERQLPLLVHCTAGKDRTGVAIALVLAVLGVPDETILADYSLSNAHFEVFEAFGAKAIAPLRGLGINTETMQPLFTANPVTMQATLDYVRVTYGSVAAYLTGPGGVSEDQLDRLRENLLQTE
ncbi:MAG: tyrosine-protein phosphatase [Chloroflexota bacterium]